MISSFLKTFGQINDPKIRKALGLATLLTLLSIILAVTLGVTLIDRLLDFFSMTLNHGSVREKAGFEVLLSFLVVP